MATKKIPAILLIGHDTSLDYLLKRYAERSGYQVIIQQNIESAGEVLGVNSIAIFLLSMEILEAAQTLVEELANQDRGIVVCSSVADETKARGLGADYCLSHPITYDNFCQALIAINAAKPG